MRDPADTVTAELVLPAKRGRPPTGQAKTAAQRKRDQRFRDRHELSAAFDDPAKMVDMPTSSLCDALAVYVSRGHPALAGHIMAELARRSVANVTGKTPAWSCANTKAKHSM
ncbi:MAG: hypothetical protein V4532_19390, partial [Pseudomonadota bacterium]